MILFCLKHYFVEIYYYVKNFDLKVHILRRSVPSRYLIKIKLIKYTLTNIILIILKN